MNLKQLILGIVVSTIAAGHVPHAAENEAHTIAEKGPVGAISKDCQYPINDIRFLLCKL